MERRFEADEWEALTNVERVRRCEMMAKEALKLADKAAPNVAEGYLRLADQWRALATELAHPNPL